jgi:hypothetical protein
MSLVNHVHLWANSAPTNPSEAGAEHLAAREEVERHCARLFTSTGPVTPLIGEHHVTFVIPADVDEVQRTQAVTGTPFVLRRCHCGLALTACPPSPFLSTYQADVR